MGAMTGRVVDRWRDSEAIRSGAVDVEVLVMAGRRANKFMDE